MQRLQKISFLVFGVLLLLIICYYILGGGIGESQKNKLNESLVFAHRGNTFKSPENSIGSVEALGTIRANAVELDVRMTKDGILVLFHDENTQRMLGQDLDLKDQNYASLEKHKLLFRGSETQGKIPKLEDYLKLYGKKFTTYLDIKTPSNQLAKALAKLIEKYRLEDKVLIASSEYSFLVQIKMQNESLLTVLEGFNPDKTWIRSFMPKHFKPNFTACLWEKWNDDLKDFLLDKNLLQHHIIYGIPTQDIEKLELPLQHHIILDVEDFELLALFQLENTAKK